MNEAVVNYYNNKGELPESLDLLISDIHKNVTPEIRDIIDPWGNKYNYVLSSTNEQDCFLIWSFGSDGKPGGTEEHELEIHYPTPASQCFTKK